MIIQKVSVIAVMPFSFESSDGHVEGRSLWYQDTTDKYPLKKSFEPQKISVMDQTLRQFCDDIKEFPTVVEIHQEIKGSKLRLVDLQKPVN